MSKPLSELRQKQINRSFNILTMLHPLTETHFMFFLLLSLPIFLAEGFSLIFQDHVNLERKSFLKIKTLETCSSLPSSIFKLF